MRENPPAVASPPTAGLFFEETMCYLCERESALDVDTEDVGKIDYEACGSWPLSSTGKDAMPRTALFAYAHVRV